MTQADQLPDAPSTHRPSERALRYVDGLCRRPGTILAAAAILALLCAALIARLQLRTDFAELLPSSDPSVHALRKVQQRLPALEALIINIHGPDSTVAHAFADRLQDELQKLPPQLVGLAVANIKAERAWFEQHQGLFLSQADLALLRDRLQAEVGPGRSPLAMDLDAEPGGSLEALVARLQQDGVASVGLALGERFANGYFTTPDGKVTSVVVMPPGGMFREHAGEDLHKSVQAIVAKLQPAKLGLDVGLSGDIESSLEERDALENDLVWATALSVGLVCLVVVLFFGRLGALPLLALPAFFGALVAYAFAQLAFGYLNSSTAFLASIIIGNGVNFSIIQLSRYEEERARGCQVRDALALSLQNTWQATALASLAASIAYGSLILTQFRGFSQFGLIGGLGMLVAWLSTLVLLPVTTYLVDGRRPKTSGVDVARRGRLLAAPLARAVTRIPTQLLSLSALFTLLCLLILPSYVKDPFEYNFRHLRSMVSDDTSRGEARWYAANGAVFGRALNPLVVLLDRHDQVEQARQSLAQADAAGPGPPMLDRLLALDDLVPGPLDAQRRKLPILAEIRAMMTGPAFSKLPAAQRQKLAPLTPPADLQPVGPQDVPWLLRRFFSEADGTAGNVLLVFPKAAGYNPWDGRDMMRLDERVGRFVLPPPADGMQPAQGRTVGTAMLFTGMIRSIVHDGPIATLASALGVTALVVLFLRRSLLGITVVLGTLLAGFLWTVGAAALAGIRINFLNFVALPVTLGIGVDYGINIFMRARLEGVGGLARAVRATGGAVALCSATTIIGYGALLVADNRGLRSFGSLAILGEAACMVAALLMMPAYLLLRQRKKMP